MWLWVSCLIGGFAFINFALMPGTFWQALYLSGTTFFTVGHGDLVPATAPIQVVTVIEAGCGLGFLALVITYLPVLYQLFAAREAHVILLDERGGSPPTATTLLKRHAQGQSLDSLQELLREWELWASELLESHTSYPMLSYYRSQYPNLSWLSALASIMDACSLVMVGIHGVRTFQARMSFSVARLAVVELSQVLGLKQTTAFAESRLTSTDFVRMKKLLEESRLILADDAELHLARFRATYEPLLCGLAEYLMVPLPNWLPEEGQLADYGQNTRVAVMRELVHTLESERGA
jgi:hypothetical protein